MRESTTDIPAPARRERHPLPDFCSGPVIFALLITASLTVTLMWLAPNNAHGWRAYSVGMLFADWLAVVIGVALCKLRPLFERLVTSGIKIALASSAKPEELEVYKKIAEIGDLLDAETSSDDVEESKPNPDIFHAAVRQLRGIAKDRMIVFGDTPYDAQASMKAGLRSIGVLCGGFPASSLTKGGCSAIYRSPSNILINYETIFAR